jgi:hypothetical protein
MGTRAFGADPYDGIVTESHCKPTFIRFSVVLRHCDEDIV